MEHSAGDNSPFVLEDNGVDCSNDVPKQSAPTCESWCAPYADTCWPRFRQRFPAVKFHFVCLGKDANR